LHISELLPQPSKTLERTKLTFYAILVGEINCSEVSCTVQKECLSAV